MNSPLQSNVELVRPLFTGEHLTLVINAVIGGNSPGKLWVDDGDQPRGAFLWDTRYGFYLAGAANPAFSRSLGEMFAGEITPYALEQRLGIFKLHTASEVWERHAESLFANYALRKRERVFYRLAAPKISNWRERLPAGFRVSAINAHFDALSRLQNFERVIEEAESCWNSLADFRQRGFGMCAHDDQAVVCWCTSEYVSGDQCGIGIETVEDYQRRGFATLTASAFVEHCQQHGITPHWDAWKTNLPSTGVAERVGFRKIEDYTIWIGNFGGKW